MKANTRTSKRPVYATDDTGPRIRAYLDTMEPPRGNVFLRDAGEKYARGLSLIERMADSCEGMGKPQLPLSKTDCADVLFYMLMAEPRSPKTWWDDSDFSKVSHICGWMEVIRAMEKALRPAGRKSVASA